MPKRILAALAAAASTALIALPASAAAPPPPVEGIPHLDHVFIIVLENESLSSTWNTPGTYLNGLLSHGTFASQYYAASHVSADNYIAMTSAQTPTPLFNSDCAAGWGPCEQWEAGRPDGGVSIADQVQAAGQSWKAYMDGMKTPCLHGLSSGADPNQAGYATRHDPFVYYPPIVGNADYCDSHVVDYSVLADDLTSLATTPNYAFITPDTCHDGHDSPCTGADVGSPGWQQGGLTSANDWMSIEVPKILASPACTTPGVASVLFITTDEAANTDATGCLTGPVIDGGGMPGTCASGIPGIGVDGGGLVGLLAIGSPDAHVTAGATTATPYDHVSLVRTVEDGLGLPSLTPSSQTQVIAQDSAGHLNNAGSPLEHAMSTLFTG
jgi:hypothetical protein